jgi:hypothetical protein
LLSVSPTLLDTRTGDGTVVIQVRGTDEGTGIQRMAAMLGIPFQEDELIGLSPVSRATLSRIGGDRRHGTWEARFSVSSCQPRDTVQPQPSYQLDLELTAEDRTGHERRRTFRSVLELQPPDNMRPRSFVNDYKAPAAGPITVYFENLVTGLRSPTIYPPVKKDYTPSAPVSGTWTCTDPQQHEVSCADGVFGSATFAPATPLQPGSLYWFVPNPEHTLDLMDLAGNPGLPGYFLAY